MAENNGKANGKNRYAQRYATAFKTSSEVITGEGPGNGYASYPWALDEYERDLGLPPDESWLIHRLLKYKWDDKTLVFPSFVNITENANTSRTTLEKIKDRLLEKGYISVAARGVQNSRGNVDRKIRYNVTGILTALYTAIICDPKSKHCNTSPDDLTPPPAPHDICDILAATETFPRPESGEVRTPADVNNWYHERGMYLDWNLMKPLPLDALQEKRGKTRDYICITCGSAFKANAHNALYCPACKDKKASKKSYVKEN